MNQKEIFKEYDSSDNATAPPAPSAQSVSPADPQERAAAYGVNKPRREVIVIDPK